VGVNAALFGEAVERKVVVPERRLALRDQPLGKALAQSIEPYFRGLSGRPEASLEFLRAAGFDSEAMVRQLDAPTRRKLGSVAGTGMQFFFDQSKPVLGLSVLDGVTKVSARGTRSLIAAGLDLAAALREAASEVDGNGGGHNIASGATVPKGKEEKFLLRVDEIVARQLATASEEAQ